MRQMYLVPVRESQVGTLALQTGRLMSGERIGLAFTSEASLVATMGPYQHWIRLAAEPLRDMLEPLGIACVRVDPRPVSELRRGGSSRQGPGADGEPRTATAARVHRARRRGRPQRHTAGRRRFPPRRAKR